MPTARCRCCGCRNGTTISHAIRTAGARLASDATDIVILGTGGSSLGGQTLAQLADYAVEGAGALRNGPRLHFMDNLDPDTYAALLKRAAARDRALCRDLEVRRHRRDPDADSPPRWRR